MYNKTIRLSCSSDNIVDCRVVGCSATQADYDVSEHASIAKRINNEIKLAKSLVDGCIVIPAIYIMVSNVVVVLQLSVLYGTNSLSNADKDDLRKFLVNIHNYIISDLSR